jgi:uncharacterized protein involved in outer membrane biogenesis
MLLACIVYVAVIGVAVDASGQRGKVSALLSESLGREVRLEGAMQFEVSARPSLHIGGMHIANAKGFSGSEFASLGDARLALNLWSLLWLRLQIEELSGSDVHIRLQLNKNGSGNWTFGPHDQPKEVVQPAATEQAANRELGNLLARLDINRVALEKLDVEFIGADAKIHYFELQSLVAHFPASQPLSMALRGRVEKNYPYQLDLTGGTIAELVRSDKPWPIDLTLGFMSSRLKLKGNLSGNTGELNFGLDSNNLDEFERLFQTRLPAVGAARVSGVIKYAPGKIALDNLSGVMGKTTLNGSLNFDYSGERPSVRGELTLPVLDLRPFMTGQPVAQEDEPSQSLADVYQELVKATFSLKELNSVDADLTLRVGQWLSLPGAVHDAILQVKLEHGRLSVPVQATVADVNLSGSVSADAGVAPARFQLALGTHDSSLGNLAGLLPGMHDVRGHLGRFDLRIAARGDRGSALMESLDMRLDVEHGKLSYGNAAGGRPVQFSLDKLALVLPAGKALRGEAHGVLLDKAFSATLQGGSLSAIMQESNTPVDFKLQAGSATAKIHAVLQPPTENSGSQLAFELAAPHSGEIASWLGLKSGADAPVNLHGNFLTDNDSWHLADFVLQLGHSALSADLQRTVGKDKALIKLQLTGDLVDVDELQSMLPEVKESSQVTTTAAVNMIDIPILPTGISLADADIAVRIKRITSTSPFAVRDLSFDGRIRDGMMPASPFAARVGENEFKGTILLDLRTQQPHSVLSLSADALDIGSFLKKLGIANNIDADVDHVHLQLDLHSSRLGQLLAQSDLALNFEGGHLTMHDVNTGGKMRIALDSGELKSAAGAAVYLNLLGSLDNVPVAIGIQTARAVDLITPDLSIPFKLDASMSGAVIKLSGDIDRPLAKNDIELALDMRGSRLDNLNTLAHTSLPPWGPWSATGKFHISSGGYEVSSLLLQVGSSQLTGQGKVNTKVVPPRIDVALTAPTIQLDDFRFGEWSPEKSGPASSGTPDAGEELPRQSDEMGNQVKQLLSPEVLRRQNAYVTVRVDQVVSGQDMLGSGKFEARLEQGRAVIGPVIVNTPGGSASLRLGYDPGEKDVAVNLRAEVKRFDYGILARRIDHNSEMRGIFSLNVDISARARYLSELLRYGKGNIDLAVWPENQKSGLLDFWAVNVLMALLPAVDSSNASVVNCVIGRFELRDGKLSDKTFLIDTSQMRVTGKGGVDFASEQIDLYMQPRAKTPQFLSFTLPIELSGNFNDFSVGVRPLDVLETVGQLATSVVWVPLQMLFGKETPADGRDVCKVADFK